MILRGRMGSGVEIRAVPRVLDGWEIVSSRECCVFEWERMLDGGIVYFDARHVHEQCRNEVYDYALRRHYRIQVRRDSTAD